jgi:phage-related protein
MPDVASPGDLITGVGVQYQFGSMLFGTGSDCVVTSVEGLDSMPDLRTDDVERNDDHGSHSGIDQMQSRVIDMEATFSVDSHATAMASIRSAARVMRPQRSAELWKFVFQRPGEPRKFCWAKPRRRQFPSNYDLAHGRAEGKLQWYCPDPRIYRLAQSSYTITLNSGQNIATDEVITLGDFDTKPVLTITGQGTNPRIANADDGGRTVRFDLVMGGADVLVLDFARRTARLNGNEAYQYRRGDNEWWTLLDGANTVTVSRADVTGLQTYEFRWNDAWV